MGTEHNIADGTVVETYWGSKLTVDNSQRVPSGYIGTKELVDGYPLTFIRRVVSVPDDSDETGAQEDFNSELLALAVDYERPLSFTYRKPNGDVSQREIVPSGTHETPSGNVVVYGEDDDGEIKSFRLDRIQGYASV